MYSEKYLPEGLLIHSDENRVLTSGEAMLYEAFRSGRIVEGKAILCDENHNLTVDFGTVCGIIPYHETALGIESGKIREIAIISRVGKPVSCVISHFSPNENLMLSRKEAQRRASEHIFNHLTPGDIIPARVTHIEPFGAFVDIGCGLISLLGIECISISRITHPSERFQVGDCIFVVISGFDTENQRVLLSHRELLGTWEENAARFSPGQTVTGVVRGVEEYGVFVELTPNLSGLAEAGTDLLPGDVVSVYIKSITRKKMKIKLVIIDKLPQVSKKLITPDDYFLTEGHIDRWEFSPGDSSKKKAITVF